MNLLFSFLLLVITTASPSERTLYRDPTFNVSKTTNVTYAQGLVCENGSYPGKDCKPKDLLLDIYEPTLLNKPVPAVKPAYILMHGGGNNHGDRTNIPEGSVMFWASRGMVVFNIEYRLLNEHGLLPEQPSNELRDDHEWTPQWRSTYPAVRDLKAAIRFVKAHAEEYGVDASLVTVSGGSAGATNSLAAGVTFEDDYARELTVEEDPTLKTAHLEQNATVQCVVAHWSTGQEVGLIQEYDPKNRSRWSAQNAPIIEFHGDQDSTIYISQAYAVQKQYNITGVPYELHVLKGCAHAAWCYDGKGQCRCQNNVTYAPNMDITALPFVAKQLGVQLV